MKYNLLYGVVIGISCNFMYAMNEEVESVPTISVEQFQQLSSKVDQLHAQVNPSLIKSWLMWGGKWAAIGGTVSIASYFAVRYWFDLASPQDLRTAFNQIQTDAQACNDEFSKHARGRIAEISSLLHKEIDGQRGQQSDQLNMLDGFLQGRFATVNNKLIDVEQLISKNPDLVSILLKNYAGQQQAALEESGRQLQLGFDELQQQTDEHYDQQQKALGRLEEGAQAANKRALALYDVAQAKARKVLKDRDKIQRGFDMAQAQQRQLRELQQQRSSSFKALPNSK